MNASDGVRYLFGLMATLIIMSCKQDMEKTNYYNEVHRPQIHFSPEANWMNDPNGMVYYDGEYHLFYQYYPDSTVWGPMHWGHAVSEDLIHWEHLPIALYPDNLGCIFSGSAVVDWNNTSGLGENGKPPLVAIFTHHDFEGERSGNNQFQYQSIAYSNDRGRSWTKYEGNPVVPNPGIRDFRDPKVRWHAESRQWIMVFAAWDHIKFYTSPDLINWSYTSDFGRDYGNHEGVWECPDLFPLHVEGSDEVRWVLIVSIGSGGLNGGSATQYFVGDFDGNEFMLDELFAKRVTQKFGVKSGGTLLFDFEGEKYSDKWNVEGEAFGSGPVQGSFPGQERVTNYTGLSLVNSYKNGDQSIGKMTSKPFRITKDFINLKVGGGNHEGKTCVNLLVDGNTMGTHTGENTEKVVWKNWNVADHKGKNAVIEIVDNHQGDWGHILVDEIMLSDVAAEDIPDPAVWLDYGRDNYAGVTWSDIPEDDGRTIFLGWMSNWQYAQIVPTEKWRSAMTIPRKLSLVDINNDLLIRQEVVKELDKIRIGEALKIDDNKTNTLPGNGLANILLTLKRSDKEKAGFKISNTLGEHVLFFYDPSKDTFYLDRMNSGNTSFSGDFAGVSRGMRHVDSDKIKVNILLDHSSIEIFLDDGLTVFTEIFFPSERYSVIEIIGDDILSDAQMFELKRIW